MRWLIKNCAPNNEEQIIWGDFHYINSLIKYLERKKQIIKVEYFPWSTQKVEDDIDIVFLLRGAYRNNYVDTKKINIIWIISLPGEITEAELANYDLILVASTLHAKILRSKLGSKVVYMPQCTDPEVFYPVESKQSCFLGFCGNTRGMKRPGIIWASKLAPSTTAIYGRGRWHKWVKPDMVKGDHIPNERLRNFYCSSRAILNDHYPDQNKFGYLNNRTFDVLACGVPVVSDWSKHFDLLSCGILFYKKKRDLAKIIKELTFDYDSILDDAKQAREIVLKEYTFEVMVDRILSSSILC